MKTFLDCWIRAATTLFAQALAGGPELIECSEAQVARNGPAYVARISGDITGSFTVTLDRAIVDAPLMGDGIDQTAAWLELLREVAEAAAGELLASNGQRCRIDSLNATESGSEGVARTFQLKASTDSWSVFVKDELRNTSLASTVESPLAGNIDPAYPTQINAGTGLLLDVELEATLRFGCREMPLGEILELGPGDVIELDRHVDDPVDLVVGDKIVARGEVVLVNGNFGLRVTEVAAPKKRLESIRCLF